EAEGLRHFDRLVDPPECPIIDFRAAAACLITNRFEQGAALARRFLQRTEDDGRMDDARAKARLIHAECRRLNKPMRRFARQANLPTGGDKHAAVHDRRQARLGPRIGRLSRESPPAPARSASGRRARPPSPVAALPTTPEPLPAPPVLDLPSFPSLDVSDICVEFTFDRSGFPDLWAH